MHKLEAFILLGNDDILGKLLYLWENWEESGWLNLLKLGGLVYIENDMEDVAHLFWKFTQSTCDLESDIKYFAIWRNREEFKNLPLYDFDKNKRFSKSDIMDSRNTEEVDRETL